MHRHSRLPLILTIASLTAAGCSATDDACDDIFKPLEQAKIDGDTTSLYQAIDTVASTRLLGCLSGIFRSDSISPTAGELLQGTLDRRGSEFINTAAQMFLEDRDTAMGQLVVILAIAYRSPSRLLRADSTLSLDATVIDALVGMLGDTTEPGYTSHGPKNFGGSAAVAISLLFDFKLPEGLAYYDPSCRNAGCNSDRSAIESWWKSVRPTTRWDRTKLCFVVGSPETEGT